MVIKLSRCLNKPQRRMGEWRYISTQSRYCMEIISFKTQPFYLWEGDPCSYWTVHWAGPTARLDAPENREMSCIDREWNAMTGLGELVAWLIKRLS
jgi:hypothetical protein